jgi:tetratricopeptide (TPR) repeat protein
LTLAAFCLASAAPAFPQSDQDTLFNQAVQDYKQNQFKKALGEFQQVNGAHAAEAQEYAGKIRTYQEAWSAAITVLRRSPDERDARSLAYALEELQVAINIKPDGPGDPKQQMAQALELKQKIEQDQTKNSTGDAGLCAKALAAASEHQFKDASALSCMLANDNPGYSCGGNEAVYLCHLNTDMAKTVVDNPVPANKPPSDTSGAFDKAKAAYDSNDFERARSLLSKVSGDSKTAADELLDKISRFSESMSNGDKLGRDGKYEEARAAFLSAAGIKPDGPGNPQNHAATMELFLGLDQFYSGDYVSATQHLETCSKTNTGKPGMVHFYLGASKLARFFVTGSDDSALHADALSDLKLAKQEGFKISGEDLSPRILDVYKGL